MTSSEFELMIHIMKVRENTMNIHLICLALLILGTLSNPAEAFSPEMTEATSSCLEYAEDLPSGEDETGISLRIEGKNEGMCIVSLGSEENDANRIRCALNDDQLQRLVAVMQNMSDGLANDEWKQLWEEYAKSSCGLGDIQIEHTSEEKADSVKVADYFTQEFMGKLRLCQPAVSDLIGYEDDEALSLEIIGKEGDKCMLKYGEYKIMAPLDILPNIHSFEDLQIILRNKEMSHYEYTPQYIYDGLLFALDACRNKRDYMGRQVSGTINKAQYTAGLTAEYFNQMCTIYLANQLDVMGDISDWTVICRLKETEVTEILSYYQQILDEYGKKQRQVINGRLQTIAAKENEVTHQADQELMYYLQQNGFCQKPDI